MASSFPCSSFLISKTQGLQGSSDILSSEDLHFPDHTLTEGVPRRPLLSCWRTEAGPEVRKPCGKDQLRQDSPSPVSAALVQCDPREEGRRVLMQEKHQHIFEVLNWTTECLEMVWVVTKLGERRQMLPAFRGWGTGANVATRGLGPHQFHPRPTE